MSNNLEKITGMIYKERKNRQAHLKGHLTEEQIASFADGLLLHEEKGSAIKHLLECNICSEYLITQLKIKPHLSLDVPEALLEKVKKLVKQETGEALFEIFLKLKEKAMEIIETSGDILFGQELVPAPVLRSRHVSEFKEEINILKDLQQIRVIARIQNKNTKSFSLTITVKDKQSQKPVKDLRVSLLKDGIELESYVADSYGSSCFENISPGDYVVELSRQQKREALIDLKVKV